MPLNQAELDDSSAECRCAALWCGEERLQRNLDVCKVSWRQLAQRQARQLRRAEDVAYPAAHSTVTDHRLAEVGAGAG